MSNEIYVDGLGIAPGVVDTIVIMAAREVEGVAGIGSAASTLPGIKAVLGGQQPQASGVEIVSDEDGLAVSVRMQVAYGYRLTDVAAKVDSAFEDTQDRTEEFRAKIETARERMDQIRATLASNVSQAANSIRIDVEDVTPQEVVAEPESSEEVQQEPTAWTVKLSNSDTL